MSEKDFKAMFDAIEPDCGLIERTKRRMRQAASAGSKPRGLRLPALRLAAAACVVAVAALGLLTADKQSAYPGSFGAQDKFYRTISMPATLSTDSIVPFSTDPNAPQPRDYRPHEAIFRECEAFARAECGPGSLILAVRARVHSSATYLTDDQEAFGIAGFEMLDAAIAQVLYPESGGARSAGDTITLVRYIRDAAQPGEPFIPGASYLFYLYTGSGFNPADTVGAALGLEQSWLIYEALPAGD